MRSILSRIVSACARWMAMPLGEVTDTMTGKIRLSLCFVREDMSLLIFLKIIFFRSSFGLRGRKSEEAMCSEEEALS